MDRNLKGLCPDRGRAFAETIREKGRSIQSGFLEKQVASFATIVATAHRNTSAHAQDSYQFQALGSRSIAAKC
jgi:hypothetical protein